MPFFDTHAHYDDDRFQDDRDSLLTTLHTSHDVAFILNPSVDLDSSRFVSSVLTQRFTFVYGAVGVYPHNTSTINKNDLASLYSLAKTNKKIRAVGEIGLDYFYNDTPPDIQRVWFREQMDLARQLDLPVIIHDRQAHEDCIKIIQDFPTVRGVFHCFSGSLEMASLLWRRNYCCSFTGSITFKNARKLPEVVRNAPAETIMLETDAPYLTPVPYRGRRNDSGYLSRICQVAAEFRGEDPEALANLTFENGCNFFQI